MRNLLYSTWKRVFHCIWFWIGIAGMVLQALYGILNNYAYRYLGPDVISPDNTLFSGAGTLDFLSCAFVCMFIGTDYSSRAINNKIVVGHSRPAIYICNQIICSAAVLMMHLTSFFVNAVLGTALLGEYKNPEINAVYIACSILTVIAKVSILVFLAMMFTKKAVSLVVVLCLICFMQNAVAHLNIQLQHVEFIEVQEIDEDGNIEVIYKENPAYIKDENIRRLYEQLRFILPYGQDSVYGDPSLPEDIALFPVYSAGFGGIFISGGILCFKRKDLK